MSVGAAHQPALDGMRGLSVALVLLFHGGWARFSGGYVGVSVFFTLSGFLITSVLLRPEHAATGEIDVRRFWVRRMRRLMPASVVCLSGVAVLGGVGAFGDVPSLGGDLAGCVLQAANWFQLAGDTSYSEQVLGLQSPLDHFWSLAVEEQFYWLWPLAMLLIVRRRRPHMTIAALAIAGVVAAPLIAWRWGPDAAYWSTPARVGEILMGAALSAAIHARRRPVPASVRWLGWPALGGIVWATLAWRTSSGPAYAGWFPLFAVFSAGLVLALQAARHCVGRWRRHHWCGWAPSATACICSTGRCSCWSPATDHSARWPVSWWPWRSRSDSAAVLYRWIEQPIRHGGGLPVLGVCSGRALAVGSGVALAGVVVAGSGLVRRARSVRRPRAGDQPAPAGRLAAALVAADLAPPTSTSPVDTSATTGASTIAPTRDVSSPPAPSSDRPALRMPVADVAVVATPSRPRPDLGSG